MNDETDVLKLVTSRLDAARIVYMITGSLALSHYAQPRMTRDIDLVVALQPADAALLVDVFGDEFDCDVDAIRSAISREGLFNLIHTTRIVKVDVVVRKSTAFRLMEFSRRRRVDVAGNPMWIVSAEDLLLSKLVWASGSRSAVQLADARNLVASVALDWAYTEVWAADLGATGLLAEVRS